MANIDSDLDDEFGDTGSQIRHQIASEQGAADVLLDDDEDASTDSEFPPLSQLNIASSQASSSHSVQDAGTVRSSAQSSRIYSRITMNREMRNCLMSIALSAAQDGRLRINKPAEMRPFYESLLKEMSDRFPGYPWTEKLVKDKFKDEKIRFQDWLTMSNKSGVGPDENGLMQAPPDVWDSFLSTRPKAKWMKNEPLGDYSIYREVFFREVPVGSFVREAGEEDDIPESISDGDGEPIMEGTSSAQNTPNTPATHRPSVNKRRRLEPDDEFSNDSPSPPTSEASSVRSSQKLRRQALENTQRIVNTQLSQVMETFGSTIERSFAKATRSMGSDDVAEAIRVIQRDLEAHLEPHEVVSAFFAMKDPMNAVVFCQINGLDKQLEYVRRLL